MGLTPPGISFWSFPGGADKNVVVFDKSSEQILATLKGHTKKVTSVVFHPSQVRSLLAPLAPIPEPCFSRLGAQNQAPTPCRLLGGETLVGRRGPEEEGDSRILAVRAGFGVMGLPFTLLDLLSQWPSRQGRTYIAWKAYSLQWIMLGKGENTPQCL